MRRLRILVDMDDVLWDLLGVWIEYLNTTYGSDVKPSDIKEWDMQKAFPNLSRLQLYLPLRTRRLWEMVKPIEGAQHYLRELYRDGHEVFIVSASSPETIQNKVTYALRRHFPYVEYKDIIFTHRKDIIDADVLIDDAPHNFTGGKYKCILMDAPHNRWFDARKNGCYRVKGWKEIYQKICELAKGDN